MKCWVLQASVQGDGVKWWRKREGMQPVGCSAGEMHRDGGVRRGGEEEEKERRKKEKEMGSGGVQRRKGKMEEKSRKENEGAVRQ